MDELREMQHRTHEWGRRNQVTFDPAKKTFPYSASLCWRRWSFQNAENTNWLQVDGASVHWRLPVKRTTEDSCYVENEGHVFLQAMLNQYKTHIWSSSEYHNGALVMALPTQLQRIDKMLRWILHELGVANTETFILHNFAPPSIRRRIGIFLHKRKLEICLPVMTKELEFVQAQAGRFITSTFESHWSTVRCHSRMIANSLHMCMLMHNKLPQEIVDLPSVSSFQKALTEIAKTRAEEGTHKMEMIVSRVQRCSRLFLKFATYFWCDSIGTVHLTLASSVLPVFC